MASRFSPLPLIPMFALASQTPDRSVPTDAEVASPQALFVGPIPVRLVPIHPMQGCPSALASDSVANRLALILDSSGVFVPSQDASALMRIHLDTVDGTCRITAELEKDGVPLEGYRLLAPEKSLSYPNQLKQAVDEVADNWYKLKSARLTVITKPSGVPVLLNGVMVGNTPISVEHLNPGSALVRLAAQGWESISDTLLLEASSALRREYALRRSPAWLDSVHRAEVAHRSDSIWIFARTSPAQALPELFSRLVPKDFPAGRQSVAIIPFQVEGVMTNSGYNPGMMAAEYGVAQYGKDPRFVVVEREELNRLLGEQALAQAGAVDDSGAAQAGKLLAVRYLVTGTVRFQGAKQEFTARMVSVETGQIVSAAVATCASDNLENLYRTAIGERGQMTSSLYRSAVGPGWGQFYTDHPIHGGIALGATVAALGFAGWSWFDYSEKDEILNKYLRYDPSTLRSGETPAQWASDAEAARKANNDASLRFGLSLGVLGGVWALNLVDAGILGYEESRRIRTEYFSWMPSATIGPDNMRLSWRF